MATQYYLTQLREYIQNELIPKIIACPTIFKKIEAISMAIGPNLKYITIFNEVSVLSSKDLLRARVI